MGLPVGTALASGSIASLGLALAWQALLVHALMESLGASEGSIEAVDTTTSAAVGAVFGGTSKEYTRASGLVQSATSGFLGNRITDITSKYFDDSWDGRLARAATDNIVSEITGEATARGVIEGMARTGASQIAKKLAGVATHSIKELLMTVGVESGN